MSYPTWHPQSMPDASVTDPNWPVGYPCRCCRSYNQDNVHIQAGTQGKVLKQSPDKNGVFVTMTSIRPPRNSWVPISVLKIGASRKYGDIIVEAQLPPLLLKGGNAPPNSAGSQLHRALDEMSIAFRDNTIQMPWLPIWFVRRLENDAARVNLINAIHNGVPDPVRRVLDSPTFSIFDLRAALTPVSMAPNEPAVYTIIYWDFEDGRDPAQYIGKSVKPQDREFGHDSSEDKEKRSLHYRVRRTAKQNLMGILSYVHNAETAAAAEQFWLCLFQTYTKGVFSFNATTPSNDQHDIASLDASVRQDKIAKYIQDKIQAKVLSRLADDSFQRSRWPGGQRRTTYRASTGCNWNSPIVEMMSRESTIWVKTSFPEANLDLFRRPASKIVQGMSQNKQFYVVMETAGKATKSRGKFTPNLPNSFNIGVDTWVYPVIEITRDDSPHHLSWSRLPEVGPWEDWDQARSWALKIEWQTEEGKWLSAYLSAGRVFEPRMGVTNLMESNGAMNAYAQGIAVFRYLRQKDLCQVERPVWLYDYGAAVVKEQTFDWLHQRILVTDKAPELFNEVHHAPMKDVSHLLSDYLKRNLNPMTGFGITGPAPALSLKPRVPPNACDSCHLLNIKSRTKDQHGVIRTEYYKKPMDCTPVPAERYMVSGGGLALSDQPYRICVRCRELGRICTWTESIDDCMLESLQARVLLPRPKWRDEIFDVQDPGLRNALVDRWESRQPQLRRST